MPTHRHSLTPNLHKVTAEGTNHVLSPEALGCEPTDHTEDQTQGRGCLAHCFDSNSAGEMEAQKESDQFRSGTRVRLPALAAITSGSHWLPFGAGCDGKGTLFFPKAI